MAEKLLEGYVAVVTGASSGIGTAIAVTLGKAGCKVALAARRLERLMEVEGTICNNGGTAISIKTDVTKRNEVKDLLRQTEEKLGPVDILVNNAGTCYYTLMKNAHEDEWEHLIDVNIKGVNNCIAAVFPGMVQRKKGHIISISSNGGRKVYPGLAIYCGTNCYVQSVSQCLRQEVAESGVKVTVIQPGEVNTDIYSFSTDKEAMDAFIPDTSKYKYLEPEDVAKTIVFALTQPENVAVNEILVEPRGLPC